ncbi:MAG TPA: ParB/RepB/Spo0J family partition protein [Candidatus Ozemobacteraceae bacterium]
MIEGKSASPTPAGLTFDLLPIEKVTPNPNQPRKLFDRNTLEELAQSIRANGVLQPILVRRWGDGYQIISGERRYQACKIAGLTRIPAVLRDLNEQQTLLAGLIENIQREDLNPVEEAMTLRQIILEFGLTHDELAKRLGRSRSALTNRLRLLSLPAHVQQLIAAGRISAGHAKMLAGLREPHDVQKWVDRILSQNLSVYETEKELAEAKPGDDRSGKKARVAKKRTESGDIHVRQVETRLQELLGAKVHIRQGRAKSRIEIEFYSNEDLERVVELMLSVRPA